MSKVAERVLQLLDLDDSTTDDLQALVEQAEDVEWLIYVVDESVDKTSSTDEAIDLAHRTIERFPTPPDDHQLN